MIRKYSITFIIALGLVSVFGLGTAYSQSRVSFDIYTTGQPQSQQRVASKSFDAYVSMDTVQSRSSSGIGLVIHVINTSGRSITVFNPLESLQLVILNAAGEQVHIPHLPQTLIDGTKGTKGEEAYAVAGYTINKKAVGGGAAPDKITLPAKGQFEIALFVPQVLAGKQSAQSPQQRVSVQPGRYQFFITLSVSDLQSNTILQAGPISINYH